MASIVGTLTLRASSALTASATGASTSAATVNQPSGSPIGDTGLRNGATFHLSCSTSAGTNRRLLVGVVGEETPGDGLRQIPGVVFGCITSTGYESITYYGPLPSWLFSSATVAGTSSPSFTFSLKATAIG